MEWIRAAFLSLWMKTNLEVENRKPGVVWRRVITEGFENGLGNCGSILRKYEHVRVCACACIFCYVKKNFTIISLTSTFSKSTDRSLQCILSPLFISSALLMSWLVNNSLIRLHLFKFAPIVFFFITTIELDNPTFILNSQKTHAKCIPLWAQKKITCSVFRIVIRNH